MTTPCPLGGAALHSGKTSHSDGQDRCQHSGETSHSDGQERRPMNNANMLMNVYFICRLKPHCEVSNALKKWHIAYHGTSVGTLRRTLDHNQLLPGMETA